MEDSDSPRAGDSAPLSIPGPQQDQVLPGAPHIARRILVAFLLTFLSARIIVLLIMLHKVPDLFLFVGGTHVHHLNYGIILLSITGAATLLFNLTPTHRKWAAIAYGIGLGLTFDEFGMWLHLGGSYWQRASYDAVITISAILGLISVAPTFARFKSVHWTFAVLIMSGLAVMVSLVLWLMNYTGKRFGNELKAIEYQGPKE